MRTDDVLLEADRAFQKRQYQSAIDHYKQAQDSGVGLSDEQLFRYAKALSTQNQAAAALAQMKKISDSGLESFDSLVFLYELEKETGVSGQALIERLLEIGKISYDGALMLELAQLYEKNGEVAPCRRVCKQIIRFFRSGEYVDKANALLNSLNPHATAVTSGDQAQADDCRQTAPAPPVSREVEPEDEAEIDADAEDNDTPDFLTEAFAGIIGMASVKENLREIYNYVRIEQIRAENLAVEFGSDYSDDSAYNFVLYGNPGTGKTTVAKIIGKVLNRLGIRSNGEVVQADRSTLVGAYIGETAKLTKKVIDEARDGTLFIDEAYSLYKKDSSNDFGIEAIETLLKDMEDNRSEYSVILAGYKDQMDEMLNKANPGFRSRFNFFIEIPDYTDDELIQIAHTVAAKSKFLIDSAGDEAIRKQIERARIDETFGNARFIRELIGAAKRKASSRLAKYKTVSKADLLMLTPEDICPPMDNEASLEQLFAQLNALTGLQDVKDYIRDMKNKILVQKKAEERGVSWGKKSTSMHMVFKGNPGTGKTTAARLVGKILSELGVLKRGEVFKECTRGDLVGRYVGETAIKTKDVIKSALGGVLFIDEAYALKNGDNDGYGQEAVDTLVAEMENRRDSLAVILAGYTEDMDNFLMSNQGLRSRINHDLIFKDYTLDEMVDIFFGMVQDDGLIAAEELRPNVAALLKDKSRLRDFGNARGVRNVFAKVCSNIENRNAQKIESGAELAASDFTTVLADDLSGI